MYYFPLHLSFISWTLSIIISRSCANEIFARLAKRSEGDQSDFSATVDPLTLNQPAAANDGDDSRAPSDLFGTTSDNSDRTTKRKRQPPRMVTINFSAAADDDDTSDEEARSNTDASPTTSSPNSNQFPLPNLPVSAKLVVQNCNSVSKGRPKVPLDNPFAGVLPECAQSKYRSYDGTCNNIAFPKVGAVDSVFTRMLAPDYADSMSSPRTAKGNGTLPSARIVSKRVASDADVKSPTTSHMMMQFGQLIDHDITNTARAVGADGATPSCCPSDSTTTLDPVCFPISLPDDDLFFSKLGKTCMEFVRSLAGTGPGCNNTQRQQVNQNTAFIDGSAIYGSDKEFAEAIRLKKRGQLKSFKPKDAAHGTLLPRSPDSVDCVQPTKTKMCFAAGDNRVDTHLGIAGMQTLWLRQHNRVAEALFQRNKTWSDEKIFQEARHITIAQLQHITYNEFLPVLLGPEVAEKFGLRPLSTGRSSVYNIALHPGILNEFAAAAYRVGHTMVPSTFRLASKDYASQGSIPLKSTYFHPFTLYDKDGFDELIFGMLSSPAQETDNNFVDDLSDHLFEAPTDASGLDLTALNVQRGRDHGLAGWMKWRELCKLPTANTFEGLHALNALPIDVLKKMEKHYTDVADIDLYIAGASENHLNGAKVGPTFACIIAEQFRRLKLGDRFWFENDLPLVSVMSEEQVNDIRKTTMSKILCDNTPLMETVQTWSFLLPNDESNPVISCKSIPASSFITTDTSDSVHILLS